MLKYLAKSDVGGIEVRVIQSSHGFAVIYGMESKKYETESQAWKAYGDCLRHAADLL